MDEPATIEFLAFLLQQAPGVGVVTLRSVLARMAREKLSPEAFLRLDDHTLSSRYGLKPPAITAIRHPTQATLETWERLRADSVHILVLGQREYPQRLASLLLDTAPPILFALGNLDICKQRAVGFCGSRKASDKGLQVARECASLLATAGVNVVSGYAHGVDLAAHRAALESGGVTMMVLAEGIHHFRLKDQISDLISASDFSRLLVISEFSPGLPWRAHNAMTRNRTICGLSHAMIVIESGLEGGTFEAGKTALELGEPLFCVEYAEPSPAAAGNPYFLQHGASSLKRTREGKPNLSRLLSLLQNGATEKIKAEAQGQLVLREEASPEP
jgi:DNA protecting protein DprA